MAATRYKLEFLPLFEEDLNEITDYISGVLHDPDAALRLVEDVERAIFDRLKAPTSFEKYYSLHERKHPYYRIRVRNYTVFYVVIDDVMEVRRILYSRRDFTFQL